MNSSRALLEHIATLEPRAFPRSDFDMALLTLLELQPRSGTSGLRDGRRRQILEALEHRAKYGAIRMWRRGRARVPEWAWDIVEKKLTTRLEALERAQRKRPVY